MKPSYKAREAIFKSSENFIIHILLFYYSIPKVSFLLPLLKLVRAIEDSKSIILHVIPLYLLQRSNWRLFVVVLMYSGLDLECFPNYDAYPCQMDSTC